MAGGNLIALPGDYSGGNPTMTALQQLLSGIGQTKGLQAMGVPKSKAGYISMLPEKLQAEAVKKLRAEQQMAALKQMYMQQQQQQQGGQQQVDPQTGQPIGQGDSVPSQQMGQQLAPQMGQQIDPSQQMPQQVGGQQGAVQPQGGGMMGGMASDPMGSVLATSMFPKEMQPTFMKFQAQQMRGLDQAEQSVRQEITNNISPKISSDTEKLDNLRELKIALKNNKVMTGPKRAAIKKMGLDDYSLSPETQYTDKIAASMLINEIGGTKGLSRVTDFIIKQLSKALPSTIMRKDAANMVIDLKTLEANKSLARNRASMKYAQSFFDRGQKPPVDWRDKGAATAQPQIDQLESKFRLKMGKRTYSTLYDNDKKFKSGVDSGEIKNGSILKDNGVPKFRVSGKSLVLIKKGQF